MLQSNESESDFPDPIDYMEVISNRFSPPIHLDSRKNVSYKRDYYLFN